MAATKKSTVKKAKAPVKSVKKTAAATARVPRKQPAASKAGSLGTDQESPFIMMLVSLFAVLSVLFALMTYWRYYS